MTVVIATKGRPQKLARLLSTIPNWIPVRIHATAFSDLPDLKRQANITFGQEGVVESFNLMAMSSSDDILPICDDVTFSPSCFDELLRYVSANPSKEVFGLNIDNHKSLDCSAVFVKRRFLQRRGFLFHPDFQHFFVDNEIGRAAKSAGLFMFCKSATLQHHHPDFSKEYDATHSSGRKAKLDHDKLVWERVKNQPVKWLDTECPLAATV